MNKSQNNYLSMVNAVCDVFDSNKPLWEGKPLVLASVGRVKSLRDSINDTATRQKNNAPKGHTEAKEAARTMLEDSIFNVGRRLRAFGRLEEDVLAERQATFSRSSLDSLSLHNLLNLSRAIVETCKTRLPALADYEIDEALLAELQTAIDGLSSLAAHRDAVEDARMENTSSLVKLLDKIRAELKTLDALVDGFVDDETFLTVYFNARRLHDVRGAKRTA